MSSSDERLREAVQQGLRKCRVEDGAPVGLFREGDLFHISHMVTQALLDSPAMRDLLAEAWDKGWCANWPEDNPYRAEEAER